MIHTDVIIIGGGATGAGIARDLTLRGIPHCLIEKKDLAAGATGACHGLLHSGGRYVVQDLEVAHECITENLILSKIGDRCVETSGGLFVQLPGDSDEYKETFLERCRAAGIPTEELSPSQAREIEPNLNPELRAAVRVPDAAIDPFRLCVLNVTTSQRAGNTILTHHKVEAFISVRGRFTGVKARNVFTNEVVEITGKIIVNATGAWGDLIARLASSKVPMVLSKGSLVIANHRVTNHVINRMRPPASGDIIVPNETVCLAGTTSMTVNDPDRVSVGSDEVDLIRREAGAMVPAFAHVRLIRSYTGVRPLLAPRERTGDDRSINRGFEIIDHGDGLVSILGGKLTTYRLMAEKMSDHICEVFGINEPCTTAEKPLDGQETIPGYPLSKRLENLDDVVCECELVDRQTVERVAQETATGDIGDIQHRTRLGMGPCQGGFCTYRALGIMHDVGGLPVGQREDVLKRFLQRRFRGIIPVLWGDQLREEQLVESIYLSAMGMKDDV